MSQHFAIKTFSEHLLCDIHFSLYIVHITKFNSHNKPVHQLLSLIDHIKIFAQAIQLVNVITHHGF